MKGCCGVGGVVRLLYHRVNNLEYDKNLLAVTPENFYDQMIYIKNNFPVIRFEDDWMGVKDDAVCITFDDGYMDNFTNALPILQELELPATIFLATGNINTCEEFWWDELERLLLDAGSDYAGSFMLKDLLFSCKWTTETYLDRNELYDTLHWLMYDKVTVKRRKDWIRQLREWRNTGSCGRKENRAVWPDEIDIDSPILTLGAHTVNHPSLRNMSIEEQCYEISQSIKDVENLSGRKVSVFSYPFGGREDFNEVTIRICREQHIIKAAANIPGIWTFQSDDYQIPRNIVRNWNQTEYVRKIEDFWKLG